MHLFKEKLNYCSKKYLYKVICICFEINLKNCKTICLFYLDIFWHEDNCKSFLIFIKMGL